MAASKIMYLLILILATASVIRSFKINHPIFYVKIKTALSAKKITVRKVSDDDHIKLGINEWPVWGCDVSTFPWTYYETETALILSGKVIVTPTDGDAVEIQSGDLVTFPEGMRCVWDVKEKLKKHYYFS